ncbi:MAG: pilus assembly protein TadG-related protein [Chloroflexota bacterium]
MTTERRELARRGERGQAMILFALLGTVLISFLALVIDVGNMYLVRRNLQNAADAAALVGAQNRLGDTLWLNGVDAVKDARAYAAKNGVYTNSGVANGIWHPSYNNGVQVNWPPTEGNHSGDYGYLEVNCSQSVTSFFAGVFGANPVRLEARAVARGRGRSAEAAIIALHDDPAAIEVQGNAEVDVIGSIYSRGGVRAQGSATLDVTGWTYARGEVIDAALAAGSQTRIYEGAPDLSDPNWPTPQVVSTGPGGRWLSNNVSVLEDAFGWKHIYPGTYEEIYVANGDRVMFHPGIYEITGGASGKNFSIQGTASGKSPLPIADPTNPPHGDPVSFVLGADVTFEMTATGIVRFRSAMWITDENGNTRAANNLVIRAKEDSNAVKIVAQASMSLIGTIYAPAGDVQLAGGSGGSVRGQVVAGTVALLGGAGPAVIWDPTMVPLTKRTWLVE